MPRQQAGVAAGITSTMRQLGSTLGVAIIGTVIAVNTAQIAPGPAFTTAFRTGWAIVAGCGLLVLVVCVVTTGGWGRRTAARTAERMQLVGHIS